MNFAEIEETRLMENIIYDELRTRGFNVDVGVVKHNYKDAEGKKQAKPVGGGFRLQQGQ